MAKRKTIKKTKDKSVTYDLRKVKHRQAFLTHIEDMIPNTHVLIIYNVPSSRTTSEGAGAFGNTDQKKAVKMLHTEFQLIIENNQRAFDELHSTNAMSR